MGDRRLEGFSMSRLLVLSDRGKTGTVDKVRACVDAGARAVVLREKDLPRSRREELAGELRPLLEGVGGVLIVASDPFVAADGVHLAAADPYPVGDLRPRIVGRSCHSLDDVHRAADEGCDYVTLSPIFESSSKPGYGPPFGLKALRAVCAEVPIPVYALGGIGVARIDDCRRAGAYGVASLGEAMRGQARFVRDALGALAATETGS